MNNPERDGGPSPTSEHPSLTVVVPMYNEGPKIGDSVREIDGYLDRSPFRRPEILVVDDGSGDDSVARVEELIPSHPRIRLLKNRVNRGKGYSVKQGVLAASSDYILFTDADLSTPISEVEKLFSVLARGYDVAIGSRSLLESVIEVPQPSYRVLIGKTLVGLLFLIFGMTYSDTQCGFKLFTRDAGKRLFGRLSIERFGFDVELLFLSRLWGLKVAEVPIRWINSSRSSVHPVWDSLGTLRDLLKLRVRSWISGNGNP